MNKEITPREADKMLRELPRTDPALWERISRPPSTDLDESDSEDDETDDVE